jgi:hypothetical protein
MIKAVITPQGSATISGTTSSSAVTPTGNGNMVRVYNAGSATAFVAVGGTAALTDMPMPSGNVEYLAVPPGSAISAITAASTATVYVTRCEVM